MSAAAAVLSSKTLRPHKISLVDKDDVVGAVPREISSVPFHKYIAATRKVRVVTAEDTTMASTLPADEAFWARVGSLFDFTLKFEEMVLSISLSSAFAAISPFFICHYCFWQPRCVSSGPLLWVKLFASTCLVAIKAAVLVLIRRQPEYYTDTTTPAGAVDLVAAFCAGCLVYAEHLHTLRSSGPLSMYLFLVGLADITKSRSFFLRSGRDSLGGLEAAAATLEILLLCLQDVSKRSAITNPGLRDNVGLEATSGAMSRMLFLYLRPVFSTGFYKQLMLEDLDKMDPEMAPDVLYKQLRSFWRPRQTTHSTVSRGLFRATLRTWKKHLLPMISARLSMTALRLAQPFLLQKVIVMLGTADTGSYATGKSIGLVGATIFVFLGLPIAQSTFGYLMNRYVARIRGALVALMFHKVHRLRESEARNVAAVTLMTADIDGIAAGVPNFVDIPFSIIEMSLGIFVLSTFIDIAALAVFAPVAITSVATYIIGRKMATYFAAWNKSVQHRVAETARILPQLTTIKMIGLGPPISTHLQTLRADEIAVSRKYRLFEALAAGPVLMADLMTPAIVIIASLFGPAFQGHMLASKVFPTLTVVSLIQTPLANSLNIYPLVTSMNSCFLRIEDFLGTSERVDSRVKVNSSGTPTSSSMPLNGHVRFNSADLAKHGMTEPIIRGANFELPHGSITPIIGRIGSGKSTIVEAILGHGQVLGGSVQVDVDGISYCAQSVWLQDATIRQNIIGHLKYDEAKFRKVIQACFLEEDVAWLPDGVDYVVGVNGSNLSGGQRQRVAIARTAYAEAKITILDDAFSALDCETAIVILHQLCGNGGILQRAGSTILLVTYLPECIDVCTHVLLVSANGIVSFSGKPQSRAARNEIMAILNTCNTNVGMTAENKEQDAVRRSLDAVSPSTYPETALVKQTGSWSLYRLFIDPIGRANSLFYGLFVSLFSAGETLPDIYVRVWVELHANNSIYFVGYLAIILATCVIGCMTYWLMHVRLSPRASLSLHAMLVERTMGATLRFLSATKTGHLLNFFNQDMLLLSRNLPASFLRTIYAGAYVVFQIGVVLSGASYLVISLPFLAVAVYFIQRYYLRTSRQIRILDLEMKAPLHTYFQETAAGLSHIQAFNWVDQSIQRGLELLAESQRPYYVLMMIQQWLVLILGLITGSLAVLLVSLSLFINHGASASSVGLSFLSLLALSKTFAAMIVAWTGLEISAGALSRLFDFRENTPQELKVSQEPLPKHWPWSGHVCFRDVVARYSPEDEEADPVLDHISISVAAGQRVGLVGRSGSGKSSLLLTLLGFIHYEGVVEIDGINIGSVSRDELRSRLVTISQDQLCLDGTIRDNLLPDTMNDVKEKAASDDEKVALQDVGLEQLLKKFDIWAQLASKGGLCAIVDDVGYSKGQLQLLCIARAIQKQRDTKSKLVLVDEATSSLDEATDKVVNDIMMEYFSDCTMLMIAHRRSSLKNVEAVIEMRRGRVVGVEYTPPST
ncbi:ABC multidrug [Cordyceps militaris]|uniref:ABC multidrug n=1 Tax=Cordyceps militaris TaxID=73501 RepID=A0A2H4SET9_CORMI|nr:ABC multidrug [Cordyceps militaris]